IQAEVAVAYRRMAGFNVRYPFGLDDNGLPTERLVEQEEGVDRKSVGLEEFSKRCQDVIARFGRQYEDFFRRLGFRWDLVLEYSTISSEVQRLSQQVFLELYQKGIIYREQAPVLFCPTCQTAVAQAEVEDKEISGFFYDLIFKTAEGEEVIIATTRPELLPACVGIFVHPQDERYKALVGKEIETPLGERVKVFTDDKVSPEKGTGIVMCCTYGDTTDVYWVRKHALPEKIVLTPQGVFVSNNKVPEEMQGKSPGEAREILIEILGKNGKIKNKRPIRHKVGVHERCATPIEIISIPQWFVKILPMKPQLLEAANKINWYPSYMKARFINWVEGLNWDWCISRGRVWGIPIPIFYCQDCNGVVLPNLEELPIDPRFDSKERNCPACGSKRIAGENSVLDTWFTSALTPDINNQHELNGSLRGKMYPMSMRPHAHDIIRTWTTYTIAMSLLRHGEIPWKDLMISGHVLLAKGEKISKKTGGGGYDPMLLAEKYSADALRYALTGGSLGQDVYFDEKEVRKGQRLIVKILNAGRFVLKSLKDFSYQEIPFDSLEEFDRWILVRSSQTASRMALEFERYEFGRAREIFEKFFWGDFCDNYLEIVKGRIYGEDEKLRLSGQYALFHAYLMILKMAAPFFPHITEEIYHSYISDDDVLRSEPNKGIFFNFCGQSSIHLASWPKTNWSLKKEQGSQINIALQIIQEMRRAKTEMGISLGEKISLLRVVAPIPLGDSLKRDVQNTAKAETFSYSEGEKFQLEIVR
ncbi:MAG: valine--tRNA ligase, partial [Microgenomates group bacterium]